ncbi:MAG: 3-deoxy-8-phosphooctulonate synthase [Candidatus Omnitrophica bacterium]|nr:3-deoxy-8-phosphooctulonate synthase [Candidatus Omnitrophota bacterium]MCM8793806.1 3-deoxy-8-phosphooctulonate synthase [Candidatus Omnitrophota bacterium]
MVREVNVGKIKFGGKNPLVLIAGPCVIETEKHTLYMAEAIKEIAEELSFPFVFKSSYDKANRLSLKSYRGPGLKKGLKILEKVKEKLGIPLLSDVHCQSELKVAKEVLDIIQIPAFLVRQTDLVMEAGRTGKVINLKKSQFLAPWDMKNIIEKVEYTENKKILLTERGTTFGYNNLVSDLRSLAILREFGYPVIFDATHSVQVPGGKGYSSGGNREFVPGLTRAAVAFGCEGIFLEVHDNPDKALCDGPNMIDLETLEKLLKEVKAITQIKSENE